MKKIFLTGLFLLILKAPAFADPVTNPNEYFNGPYLNELYWTDYIFNWSSNFTTNASDGTMAGLYKVGGPGGGHASGAGSVELMSKYYFTGDFNTVVDVIHNRETTVASLMKINFMFYKYGVPLDIGDHGITYGFAGDDGGYFWDENHENVVWGVFGGTGVTIPNDVWYQFRIERILDDITTYYRPLGDETWYTQNTYTDFGTDPIFISFECASGRTVGHKLWVDLDKITATGVAEVPEYTGSEIPEPATVILFCLAFAGLVRKMKK